MRDFAAAQATVPAAQSPRADTNVEVAPNTRPRTNIVADIQREGKSRGFYDGALDGVPSPKTDAGDPRLRGGLSPAARPARGARHAASNSSHTKWSTMRRSPSRPS